MRTGPILVVLPLSSRFNRTNPDSIDTVAWMGWRHSRYREHITIIANNTTPVLKEQAILYAPHRHTRRGDWRRFVLTTLAARQTARRIEVHQDITLAHRLKRRYPDAHVALMFHNAIDGALPWLKKRRRARRLKRIDSIVFTSDYCTGRFRDAYPHLADKAHTVHNAIEIDDWYRPIGAPRDRLIHFAARARTHKGVAPLVEGVSRVLAAHPDWRAALFTHEWEGADASIKALHQAYAPQDRLRWQVDARRQAVRESAMVASIAVVPMLTPEPFGLAALEAHVAGAAVISSGVGGLREVSGEAALYVEAVTALSLERALHTLVADPAARRDLAKRGQTRAMATFHPDAVIARLDALRA